MLYYLLATLYVLSCFLLLLVVLLQQGKGGDIASAFGGGGSQTAFGARAGATVLTKATAILGVLFMIGAIALGILGRGGASGSLMQGLGGPQQQTPAPTTPTTPAPSTPSGAQPPAAAQPPATQPADAGPPVEKPQEPTQKPAAPPK
jgi:preprotein translocase subunit SecG